MPHVSVNDPASKWDVDGWMHASQPPNVEKRSRGPVAKRRSRLAHLEDGLLDHF